MDNALQSFVEALAARRFDDARAFLAPTLSFRALLPEGLETRSEPQSVIQRLRDWFGATETEFVEQDVSALGDRWGFSYRAIIRSGNGPRVIQQRGFAIVGENGIEQIDLVCSGFLPLESPAESGTLRFDAGTLGCGDGLAQEFRRAIRAVPIGSRLEVLTSDPAAKEDLPPLARMMGNTVHEIRTTEDGRVAITVERNR